MSHPHTCARGIIRVKNHLEKLVNNNSNVRDKTRTDKLVQKKKLIASHEEHH
jgi:hypothetical protein